MKSTIFQIGNCFNLGCQLKIKKQFYFNAEFKLFRDKSATYIDITNNSLCGFLYGVLFNKFWLYLSINI